MGWGEFSKAFSEKQEWLGASSEVRKLNGREKGSLKDLRCGL